MARLDFREKESVPDIHDIVKEWCRGRLWLPRFAVLLWFVYLTFRQVATPESTTLFAALNLGIHELGHVIWAPFGETMAFFGGSFTQCLVPVVSVFVFLKQRDYFSVSFCAGWLGLNLFEVATYVADARVMKLPLVSPFGGNPIHDWNWLLGRWGMLHMSERIGLFLQALGFGFLLLFLVAGGYMTWLMFFLPERPVAMPNFERREGSET